MKKIFILNLMKNLIEESNYLPFEDSSGKIYFEKGIFYLTKHISNSFFLMEVIDADKFNYDEIKTRIERNKHKLSLIDEASHQTIIEFFVFETEPSQELITLLKENQLHDVYGKKFLKCLYLNLETKNLSKLFDVPKESYGLRQAIGKIFSQPTITEITLLDIEHILQKRKEELTIEYKTKRPYFTLIFIIINVIIWSALNITALIQKIPPDNLAVLFGAKENGHIINGQYFRLITPIFLHIHPLHLLLNCYSIYVLRISEYIYGNLKYFCIYLLSGILGCTASFLFSTNPSLGASGAVFGILGSLLFIWIDKPLFFKKFFGTPLILTIAANILFGLSTPGIDNFAHIGGLIGGFLITASLSKTKKMYWFLNKAPMFSLYILLILTGLTFAFKSNINIELSKIATLENLNKQNNWIKIEELSLNIINSNNYSNKFKIKTYLYLVEAEIKLGNFYSAVNYCKELTSLDAFYGHYLLGITYAEMGRNSEAIYELNESKKFINDTSFLNKINELIKNIQEN